MFLRSRYLERLQLQGDVCLAPTLDTLKQLVEAHLNHIPFENLSQHGALGVASLDTKISAEKVLDRHRGGFCYELNGMFADLLLELGYSIRRVPGYVLSDGPDPSIATHLVLLATIPRDPQTDEVTDDNDVEWFVDVGFGEPAIHPLRFVFAIEQETPDGITSRFSEEADGHIVLEWWKPESQEWKRRIKWDSKLTFKNADMLDFSEALKHTLTNSIFCKKTITCKVTRQEKLSLAGSKLKRTCPRVNGKVTTTQLKTKDEVRKVLNEEFGIYLRETEGLDLESSFKDEAAAVWGHL
eukprot:Selendium_serpulae@DN2766_c0_g1_i1.p1